MLARALLLYQQSRYDLAEQEIRRVLDQSPNDPGAHALLALCLAQQEKFDAAQQEAEQAIALAPAWAYPHSCLASVLEDRRRYSQAEAAAREAIRLEPANANYRGRLASTLFHQEKWQECYDAAVEGLALDPENDACNHLRTMALTKLGRQDDAIASVDAVLERNPNDAFAHANKGWALLHEGKPREALEHFREALRIDPTLEYAQAGIVESLKARNPVYRWILAYFLWMSRLSDRARWGVILAGYFGAKFLSALSRKSPELSPWIFPLIVIYFLFVLLTWFAVPFFNLLLRFNKYGWYALNREQRASSNWFGLCIAVAIIAGIAYFVWDTPTALVTAGVAVGLALPLVTRYSCDIGWPRNAMNAFTAAMAVTGAAAITFSVLDHQLATAAIGIFALGFIATPWLANFLVTRTVTR